MGKDYVTGFKDLFPGWRRKTKYPWCLSCWLVWEVSQTHQADGIHPTAEGAKIVAVNVWQVLKGRNYSL